MEIGDIIESCGEKRIVTGFTRVEGNDVPNTELYNEPLVTVTGEKLEDELKEESEEVPKVTITEEELIENISKNDHNESECTCQYCGKICGSPIGLKAHERACEKNPESRNYKNE